MSSSAVGHRRQLHGATAPDGQPGRRGRQPVLGLPAGGTSFAVLSSGDAVHVDPAAAPGRRGERQHRAHRTGRGPASTTSTPCACDLTVPAAANCALLSFRFLTDEDPGAVFNDGFIAELDTNDWSIEPATGTEPSRIDAPHNFAFDANGDVISVNSPGSAGLTPEGATGTGLANGTARLTAATPVTPGSAFDLPLDLRLRRRHRRLGGAAGRPPPREPRGGRLHGRRGARRHDGPDRAHHLAVRPRRHRRHDARHLRHGRQRARRRAPRSGSRSAPAPPCSRT